VLGIAALAAGCGTVGTIRIEPAASRFPAPPANATVLAREHGRVAVALALVPRGTRTLVQVSLVGPDDDGVRMQAVRLALAGATGSSAAPAKPCGAGCYRSLLELRGVPRAATVRFGASTVRFRLPERRPAQDASALLARASRTWRALRTLVFRERLASSPSAVIQTTWRVAAPSRFAYDIEGGASGIAIGARRWDRVPGHAWERSTFDPVPEPRPPWARPVDVRLLGSTAHTWRISFFDARILAWFEATVERGSFRTLELRMIAAAHFMHDVYGPFDAPVRIAPPAPRGVSP